MKDKSEPSLLDIEASLLRSGYFMESRIISKLNEVGFFVETSPPFLDPRTGKSREIDLVAEFFDFDRVLDHNGVSVKTSFVIEAVNNRFPFVLLTSYPWSPTSNDEDFVRLSSSPLSNFPDSTSIDDFLYTERMPGRDDLYCQFSEITRKNSTSELMASHSDNTYHSLLKISEFIEHRIDESAEFYENDTRVLRLHFWRPMIVLGGDLIRASQSKDDAPELAYADFGQLVFNWHDQDRPRSTVIDIVTERYLLDYMTPIFRRDTEVALGIHALCQNSGQAT